MYEYEERVVVYLDVLGWKNLVISEKTKLPQEIMGYVTKIEYKHNQNQKIKKTRRVSDYKDKNYGFDSEYFNTEEMSIFSDTIVYSHPAKYAKNLLVDISFFITGLINSGLLIRGGITVGNLYHDGNIIIGPALIEAYELENKAIYPRVICSYELLKNSENWEEYFKKFIYEDFDGKKIIKYINPKDRQYPKYPNDINQIINKNINNFAKSQRCIDEYSKWMYLKNFFDKSV